MKRKVFIAIHQLNIGGTQKALISALDAIDYSRNEVTLYIRKKRIDLLPSVNKNVKHIIINDDSTRYYRRPYAIILSVLSFFLKVFGKDKYIEDKLVRYVADQKIKYETTNFFNNNESYDVAISYIQGYTAESLLKNITAKRYIMFYHGSTDVLHELHSKIIGGYDRIYCVSKGAEKTIKACYPEYIDKFSYIENFVDSHEIAVKSNQFVPKYPDDKLVLCSCGRITSDKGFDLAVKAAKLLKDNGVNFVWYFVGDGAARSYVDEIVIENNLSEEIIITGLVDNPYPYIKNCDIYIQPSYEESYGLTIKEAMILSACVISTATVGGKELISHKVDGLICEISAESIEENIRLLLNDVSLKERIKQNLSKKDYSNERCVFCEKWKTLLED